MTLLKCEACGGSALTRHGNVYECSYCGSRYTLGANNSVEGKDVIGSNLLSLLQRSVELHAANKYHEELNVLIQAMEINSNNAGVLLKLGRCYRCLNSADKAMECYQRVIELNPSMGTAYTNMGTISLLRENYIEAFGYYEKGLPLIDKADYDYWIANANYAVAVAKLGDPIRAEEMIKNSEAHGYTNGDVMRKMAGIERKSFFKKLRDLFS